MKCNNIVNMASEYIDGLLNEKDIIQFERHLQTCEKCNKMVRDMKKTVDILHTVRQVELPPSFHENLRKSLNTISDSNTGKVIDFKGKTGKTLSRKTVKTFAAMAACAAIVFGVFISGELLLNKGNMEQSIDYDTMRTAESNNSGKPDKSQTVKETTVSTIDMDSNYNMISLMGNNMNSYIQNCYKISMIAKNPDDMTQEVKAIADKYNGKMDSEGGEDIYLMTFSIPKEYYNEFKDELWSLRKNDSIQGFIENELSSVNYEYEVKQIRKSIENVQQNIDDISEQSTEKEDLVTEKEKELDTLNQRLVELNNEVQYSKITIEISED